MTDRNFYINRNINICMRVLGGETYESAASDFDITRERARQIFMKYMRAASNKRYGDCDKDYYCVFQARANAEFWQSRILRLREEHLNELNS